MARRRGPRGKPIELFPFLAILASVIGVLTLMIAGLSMGAIKIDMTGTAFALLKEATAADQGEIEKLEREGQGARIRGARVAHARGELVRREATATQVLELQARRDAIRAQLEQAVAKRDALTQDLRKLQDRLADLENELQGRRAKEGAATAVELRGPRARPGLRAQRPRFVECRSTEIVLDADRSESERRVVALARVGDSAEFFRLLREVMVSSDGILILLVREGGVDTYDGLASICVRLDLRWGKLPVPGRRPLDFSALVGRK